MKAIKILGLLTIMSCMLPQIATAQDNEKADSTGLPGDNFSLEGALELFKSSANLEDFEKKLNDKSNNVNNLDLNNDQKVDYVKVTDKVSKGIHAIILRVNVSAKESQDVAVIAVEKNGDKSAVAQIVGDEELYGKDVVAEPIGNDETKAGDEGKGPAEMAVKPVFVVVNVWYWPCVQYIYMPNYVAWNSPWYWGYYPSYWDPWAPYPWYYHYHHCAPYRYHYHVVHVYRVNHGPVYRPYRQYSPMVHNHYKEARKANNTAVGGRASTPVGRQSEMKKTEPVSRPVEGTQGVKKERGNRSITTPEKQNPSTRPAERQNAEPARRQNVEPAQRQRAPQSSPQQRANPQVSPRQNSPQRANPQIRNQSPPMRTAPSQRQGGGMKRR